MDRQVIGTLDHWLERFKKFHCFSSISLSLGDTIFQFGEMLDAMHMNGVKKYPFVNYTSSLASCTQSHYKQQIFASSYCHWAIAPLYHCAIVNSSQGQSAHYTKYVYFTFFVSRILTMRYNSDCPSSYSLHSSTILMEGVVTLMAKVSIISSSKTCVFPVSTKECNGGPKSTPSSSPSLAATINCESVPILARPTAFVSLPKAANKATHQSLNIINTISTIGGEVKYGVPQIRMAIRPISNRATFLH